MRILLPRLDDRLMPGDADHLLRPRSVISQAKSWREVASALPGSGRALPAVGSPARLLADR